MHLIDLEEKRRLIEWASKNQQNIFERENQESSYFVDRQSDKNYIREYNFSNISDFKQMMLDICEEEIPSEVWKIISVAALKSKPDFQQEKRVQSKKEEIPEFIYVF